MLEMLLPPKPRHAWRRQLGKWFYCWKRRCKWFWGGQHFARQTAEVLPEVWAQHETPLLRRLKDVDMYLQHNKITNLQLAAARIDGVLLHPGETFSFWQMVGKPSAAKGYLPGLVLESGKIGVGVGGGLCQMGNLLYWMALHTPLTVTERWRHSYDVFPDEQRKLPFGSGATLAYNYIDLQIKNETEQPFQIKVCPDDAHLKGEIRSIVPPTIRYEVFEKDHFMRAEIWGGYSRHNRIFRKKIERDTDAVINETLVTENHAIMMYQPFLEGGQNEKKI